MHEKGQSDKERWANADAAKCEMESKILSSSARKKVVVAGPGTGKTSLFKQILKDGDKNAITLTFINSLVEDLSLELYGLSDVRTLHGFARHFLAKAQKGIRVYPQLSNVVSEDFRILTGEVIDFDKIFQAMDDANEAIGFYKKRKDWYGHYGFTDLIYAAVKYFEKNSEKIPSYDVVLVDEFQDFNDLEVRLIELLANKSPLVIAGDDDQALYDIKGASTKHIRDRYNGVVPGYEAFTLHHCRRSTRVIIDSINDVLARAAEHGLLPGRIDKKYIYLDREDKDKESARHPKLGHIRCQSGQIAFAVGKEIEKIAKDRRDKFSVLVVSPKSHCKTLAKRFRKRGFLNVTLDDDDLSENEILRTVIGGLDKIAESKDYASNLGWRIVCKHLLNADEFEKLIKKIGVEPTGTLQDSVDAKLRKKIRKLVATYKRIKGPKNKSGKTPPKAVKREYLELFFSDLGIDPLELAREQVYSLSQKIEHATTSGLHQIPIHITTITKSKGASYDYVFVAHFDDRYFLERDGKLSDKKVCGFLVALTRARKKAHLVSYPSREPTFLKWISPDRIDDAITFSEKVI